MNLAIRIWQWYLTFVAAHYGAPSLIFWFSVVTVTLSVSSAVVIALVEGDPLEVVRAVLGIAINGLTLFLLWPVIVFLLAVSLPGLLIALLVILIS